MRLALPLACCLALAPLSVAAAGAKFEITPTVSYRSQGEFDLETNDFLDEEAELKDGGAYGLNFGIKINRVLWLEFLANRQETELIEDEGLFGNERSVADVDVTYVQVGLLAQFGNGQVQPFVAGGLGVAHLAPDFPGTSDEDRFAASFGGGVKIRFNDNLGLRLEARGYVVDLDDENRGRDRDHDRDRFDEEDSALYQGEASLGLIISF